MFTIGMVAFLLAAANPAQEEVVLEEIVAAVEEVAVVEDSDSECLEELALEETEALEEAVALSDQE